MTNEWLEFKAYTDKPTYFSSGKRDFSYLGRFSFKTILDLEGMERILTIIARGYLFHDKDGNILKDDAYSRIEYAKNALCAWCSIPDIKEKSDANFDCYYGNTNFSKKWLSKIPDTILERDVASGICRVKLKI